MGGRGVRGRLPVTIAPSKLDAHRNDKTCAHLQQKGAVQQILLASRKYRLHPYSRVATVAKIPVRMKGSTSPGLQGAPGDGLLLNVPVGLLSCSEV